MQTDYSGKNVFDTRAFREMLEGSDFRKSGAGSSVQDDYPVRMRPAIG